MLIVNVPEREYYDSKTGTFETQPASILEIEHSLVSISKWESKWCKPFIGKYDKTDVETLDYIKCMSNSPVDDSLLSRLSQQNVEDITNYIQSPMTATTISNREVGGVNRVITSEVIYSWMIMLNIPFECQYWHLNRLLTLINVCNAKNTPSKKMSRKELLSRNTSLNEARKKAMKTSG